ncbi:MAG: polysaccharide biosynthesis protein, partial [Balneolales bacterium]
SEYGNDGTKFTALITDVRDYDTLEHHFAEYKPDVVFHAAAHKHVPLMESNPDQAIKNNVGGTRNLVQLALKYKVSRFVNISSDKSVNPTSVMGASKRVAEFIVSWASCQASPGQAFVSVRFGNVLGSRGSVVPLFKKQIREGGPITITHPEMTRYFMTIPEASQLVLQAGGLGGNGSVYVLDMGQPVKISDLANDLIRLSGFLPGEDIKIKYSGIRPGEKLFEELLTAEEGTNATHHSKIFSAKTTGLPSERFEDMIQELFDVAQTRDGAEIRRYLKKIIPTCNFNSFSESNSKDSGMEVLTEVIKVGSLNVEDILSKGLTNGHSNGNGNGHTNGKTNGHTNGLTNGHSEDDPDEN